MTKSTLSLTAVVLLCAGGLAAAGPVIDQSQPSDSNVMSAFGHGNLAQSFQQAHDNIVGAGIKLWMTNGSDPVTISLWDALPNQVGSHMLASGSAVSMPDNWVDVYWAPVTVVPDTTLYLVLEAQNDALALRGDISNPYSRGQVYANAGFWSYPCFDYTFRTYCDDDLSTVPAPGALLLGMLGTGAVGYFRRRRAL